MTTAAWTAYILPLDNGMAVMVGTVGAFAALAPDIDHAHSRASTGAHDAKYLSWIVRRAGDHRTVTHSALGALAFGVLTAFGVSFMSGPIGDHWWAFAIAVTVGCVTHDWGDMRTVSGVPFWWRPGRRGRRVRIGRTFVTGSQRERDLRAWVYRPVAIASAAAVLYLSM